jgi:hypothetical protein
MAYGDNLKFRELTHEEAIEVAGHPTILKIQKARGYMKDEIARREQRGRSENVAKGTSSHHN